MREDHIEIVKAGSSKILEDSHLKRKSRYDSLSEAAVWMVWIHSFDKVYNPDEKHPLSLPPDVCTIYIEHEDAWPVVRCKNCGYCYPLALPSFPPPLPSLEIYLFLACLLSNASS